VPDAITLDVLMPDRDGWSVLAELKQDATLAGVPVVLVSILDEKGKAYALGAADYLSKPIDTWRLLGTLDRLGLRRPAHVLVVEDEPSSRDMLVRLLEKNGHEVSAAENGQVALERVAHRRPDLVLLDLMMPEMDGFLFFEEFRKERANCSVPVVVVTAKDVTEADRKRLQGVERFFGKATLGPDQLVRELRALLAARNYGAQVQGHDAGSPDVSPGRAPAR
jgi:CheY-like chemotaxis protein